MREVSSTALEDPAYRVPAGPPGEYGLAWLRHHVARFDDSPTHLIRRDLIEKVIGEVGLPEIVANPTTTLLAALDLPPVLRDDVAAVALAYQRHAPQSEQADAAAERLLSACGGRTDVAAATVCVLVQAHAGVSALVAAIDRGGDEPPIPFTRRIGPAGEVAVDLADAPFGRGPHRCPGEELGRHLAAQVAV